MYITQIKPLENGDYGCALKLTNTIKNNASYNQNNQKICSEPMCERGYNVAFNVCRTNQTRGKRWLIKCTKTPSSTSSYVSYNQKTLKFARSFKVVFLAYHKNQILEKWGLLKCTTSPPSTSNNASKKKNWNLLEIFAQKVLWFFICKTCSWFADE